MGDVSDARSVSCVITTHERPILLTRAIESVLSQTHKNLELIVVDDASDDDTKSVAAKYLVDTRMRYFRIGKDESNGANHARNVGLAMARHKLIAYLDDDDEWMLDKLERQLEAMSDDIDVVSAQWIQQSADGSWRLAKSSNHDWEMDRILRVCHTGATSVPLLRISAIMDVGGFDERVVKGQEHDLWIRLVANGSKVHTIMKPLVKYYWSANSSFRSEEKLIRCTEYKLEKFASLYEEHGDAMSFLINSTAWDCLRAFGDVGQYLRFKVLGLKRKPISKWNLYGLLRAKDRLFGIENSFYDPYSDCEC